MTDAISVVILQAVDEPVCGPPRLMTETTFKQALSRALSGLSQTDIARKAGVAPSTISTWLSGGGAKPLQVFAVEEALDLPPGHLSRHLGFMPLRDSDEPILDVVYAIEHDPALPDLIDREALAALYGVFRRRSAD